MDLNRKLELLDHQITQANSGHPSDFSAWQKETEVVLRTVMGDGTPTHEDFKKVKYTPGVYISGMDTSGYRPAGVARAIAILGAAKQELKLAAELSTAVATSPEADESPGTETMVFIVHGRDEARKNAFARTVRSLTGTEPTILHEQPNSGQVLIEKFEHSAGRAGFAVILLTADDLGRARAADDEKLRARQNVVFEMGFFFGALGRKRVAVFLDEGVEEPGDVKGIVYTSIDPAGAWKIALARELDEAGIDVDWSALRA